MCVSRRCQLVVHRARWVCIQVTKRDHQEMDIGGDGQGGWESGEKTTIQNRPDSPHQTIPLGDNRRHTHDGFHPRWENLRTTGNETHKSANRECSARCHSTGGYKCLSTHRYHPCRSGFQPLQTTAEDGLTAHMLHETGLEGHPPHPIHPRTYISTWVEEEKKRGTHMHPLQNPHPSEGVHAQCQLTVHSLLQFLLQFLLYLLGWQNPLEDLSLQSSERAMVFA